jgi:hypothetical protein
MRTLTHRGTDITVTLMWIATLLVAVIGILKIGIGPIAFLCIIPWFVALFHRHPLLLVLLWPAGHFLIIAMPDYEDLVVSGFMLGPMDPVYFFTAVHLMIHAIIRPKEFLRALQANPFLSLFLVIVILYIVVYTPLHGKSALGEARKFYFSFLFPILAILSIKEVGSLNRLILALFITSIGISMLGFIRLLMGAPPKHIVNAQAALFLLLIAFSIIVYRINSRVIMSKCLDTFMGVSCISIVFITSHRSVILAFIAGLTCIFIVYMNRTAILSKMVMALTVALAVISMTVISRPELFAKHIKLLNGIINPHADDTASWRMMGWQQQLDRIWRNNQWLFGEGFGGYYQWRQGSHKVTAAPHNGYVQMILKLGLFGLCVYVLLVGKFFLTTLKARSKLSPGPKRAYVEMGIINFGAAHVYLMGYGIQISMLIFVGLTMIAIQLREASWRVPRTV